MAPNALARLKVLALAEKEEAAPLRSEFQRVLAIIRKYHNFSQLRLQTADETCFVLTGEAFDMNRQIIRALVLTQCTVSVLPQNSNRVTVVIGRAPAKPTVFPLPLSPMPAIPQGNAIRH